MSAQSKIAVVLFNLGGPDSKAAIRPFLMNFFTDPNIIRLPNPLRFLIARSIANRRSRNEAGDSYAFLGDRSPLLENSQAQAEALEKALNIQGDADYRTFVCMRYWHPMAEQVVRDVKNWNPERVVLLPLYPQYSTTTTRSSFGVWNRVCRDIGYSPAQHALCCYPFNAGFIHASVDHLHKTLAQARADGHCDPRVLFSAHGLPESVITDGDPYQWQCEEGARRMAAALGEDNLDWAMCYQSRVGPQRWIGPSTEDELARAARDGKAVVIYPHAFTQEHVETLVEIEIEYRHKAEELGVKGFYRVPTVSTNPAFIAGLAALVHAAQARPQLAPEGGARLCPASWRRCACEENAHKESICTVAYS